MAAKSAALTGERPPIAGDTPITLSDYVTEIVASGFPAIRTMGDRVRRAQLRGYLDRVIDRAVAQLVQDFFHDRLRSVTVSIWL